MNNRIEESIKDHVRKRINRYKKKNLIVDWDEIKSFGKNGEDNIREALEDRIDDATFEEGTTLEEFWRICDEIKEVEENSIEYIERTASAIITDGSVDNETEVSFTKKSAWMIYRDKLINEKKFSELSVNLIEKDTEKIRRRLSIQYDESIGAIKGVVIGSVQSGKTANMGALISQCADNGWNFFIILGGMIESLRSQTESRLISDLSGECNFNWNLLNTICDSKAMNTQELSQLDLSNTSKHKYLCVALKNKDRLGNLLKWLKRDESNAQNLKVLIIDDEADQASVNTADINEGEKKTIYALIDQLVNGIEDEGNRKQLCGGMNYVCYTATPYANFLNDSDAKSLYPNNFIATLTPSQNYFGPQQIFGIDGEEKDGLSIIRNISLEDKNIVNDIYSNDSNDMPKSLEESLLWFFCCVGAMRFFDSKKPYSMLINVSQKTDHHECVANVIANWINLQKNEDLIKKCKEIWKRETQIFSKEVFLEQFSDYELKEKIEDYPTFDEIAPYIYSLLETNTQHILFNENNQYEYTSGIHLCIDNYKNNKLTEDNEYKRLIYPTKQQLENLVAPAFIVIGGNTLSRGLTIEGLVSTYFLRAGRQADSLMQMGRWFGYRIGYELYPRIWMDDNTVEQFKFISKLDYDLRMNLNKYMVCNVSPRDVGPYINNTPAVSWLRITAKNKQQSVINAVYDYTGMQAQTITFDVEKDILDKNIEVTKSFLNKLGNPLWSRTGLSRVWKEIDVNDVIDYFRSFSFCKSNRVFNDIDVFVKWLENQENQDKVKKWNIVLSGIKNAEHLWTLRDGINISKVYRSKLKNSHNTNIKVLKTYRDNFEDIVLNEIDNNQNLLIQQCIDKEKPRDFFETKKKLDISVRPMLVLYIIDGNSKKQPRVAKSGTERETLHLENDLVGMYIAIPGEKITNNNVSKITINITPEDREEYSDED